MLKLPGFENTASDWDPPGILKISLTSAVYSCLFVKRHDGIITFLVYIL